MKFAGNARPFANCGYFNGRALTRFLTLLWLAVVAAVSMMPLKLKYRVGTTGVFHDPGHFLIFFATTLLLCRTAPGRLVRCAGVCAFAVAMEILEWVIYHNHFEWRDVLVDLLGVAIGFLVVSVLPFRLRYSDAPNG